MNPQQVKPRKKVSTWAIVLLSIALLTVILIAISWIYSQLSYLPIRAEITRIADKSGIKPISVECDSGIDIGTVCRAEYDELTEDEHSKMLKDSGYTVDMGPEDGSGYITARNSKVHIYADGGPGWQGSGFEGKTNITFQLNDYQN